jgi:hypothetical protein
MFYLAGSKAVYFYCYFISSSGVLIVQPSLLFQPIHNRAILSSDFFSALNFISRNIKRAMYHLQQYDVGCKTF